MNCFQALASMLYLSAAVECDDAGCKDVGATRKYTVELDFFGHDLPCHSLTKNLVQKCFDHV